MKLNLIGLALLLPLCACTAKQNTMNKYPEKEGTLTVQGHKVWYKIVGEKESPGKLPVLCLHGGPGANSLYLDPLKALANGRRVIFYDQLGCGKSEHVQDEKLFTVANYVEELNEVRKQLGIENMHLYGQSWGGMLAMEYYFTNPKTVSSLILSDSLASFDQWMAEANRLRSELPANVQTTLKKHEDAGTTASQEYQDAIMVYYKRHVCRLNPWPDFLAESFGQIAFNVYGVMWGASEFFAEGTLKGWDVRSKLGTIRVPTLVLSGRYDESTPLVSGELKNGIPGAKWTIFEHSAHVPHVEEPELYRQTVEEFLSSVETARKAK